jgi:DNA-binding transcriptional ArsR family regulator
MTYIPPLEALADPNRRALIERLQKGPCSVNDLTKVVSISQPAVSQHLSVLKSAGLVNVRKEGSRRIYSLAPDGLVELRRYVDNLWDDVLTAFQQAAENQAKGE